MVRDVERGADGIWEARLGVKTLSLGWGMFGCRAPLRLASHNLPAGRGGPSSWWGVGKLAGGPESCYGADQTYLARKIIE